MTQVDPALDLQAEDDPPRWYEASAADHPAATVLLVMLLVAGPLLIFWAGRTRWFYLDEWDFLAGRSATNFGDLMRAHNENWSTIPILLYRGIFSVVHLQSYWPYQVPVVVAHLCVVGLLWIIMRRSGVNQWVALLCAGLLLFFGSGYENIVWAFQIGFTGSMAFGLGQLLAADHDGPIDRRDWLGLALGLGALLCSTVGVSTVAVVGLAALLRRGWRAAAFHTLPLGALFIVWNLAERPQRPENPGHSPVSTVVGQVAKWDVATLGYVVGHLGTYRVVGVALAVLVVVGLWVAWSRMGLRAVRRQQSMVVAMLAGLVMFATMSGSGRWFFGTSAAATPRYLYLEAAFALPAVAVATWALMCRWRVLIPVLVLLLLVGVPGNVAAFDSQSPPAGYPAAGRHSVAAWASSPLAWKVPASVVPNQVGYPDLTVGWLRDMWRRGWMPRVAGLKAGDSSVSIELGMAQSSGWPPSSAVCTPVTKPFVIRPAKGSRFWIRPVGDTSTDSITSREATLAAQPRFAVADPRVVSQRTYFPLAYTTAYGQQFTIELPDMVLRITPLRAAQVPMVYCR
jgi:hypothetical protein